MTDLLVTPIPVLILWGLGGPLLDMLIQIVMTNVVGREWADRLFNVSATRAMAWVGAVALWRVWS